jgi:hypothetical protein
MSRFFHRFESRDNPSGAPGIGELIESHARRELLQRAGSAVGAAALRRAAGAGALLGLGGCAAGGGTDRRGGGDGGSGDASAGSAGSGAAVRSGRLGFSSVPVSTEDAVRVPDGYSAQLLIRWGDPIGHPDGQPAFRHDASNTADEQALQSGTHHDGMAFFPLPRAEMQGVAVRPAPGASSSHGLLATNHEYPDYGTLFGDQMAGWSAEKVRKAQHSLGSRWSRCVARAACGKWFPRPPTRAASTPARRCE